MTFVKLRSGEGERGVDVRCVDHGDVGDILHSIEAGQQHLRDEHGRYSVLGVLTSIT